MSEHYRALTRTYRPRNFDDVVAQEHVSSTLKNAISNQRLAHAYLFCGPRGVGKTTMARVLARTINGIDEDMDGEALGNTLDIIEIDGASNRKLEDAQRIREVVRIPPNKAIYKVLIIDEVHMLTKEAFNALLKTLEEPPKYLIFIFATTEPHKVLPTILSRCQRFDFRRISVEEIVQRLEFVCTQEAIKIDSESLHLIARKADGALRDALSLMDQAIAFCGTDIQYEHLKRALNAIGMDIMFEITDFVKTQDAAGGLAFVDHILSAGFDIQEFLIELTEHLRNLFVAKQPSNVRLIEATEEMKQRYVSEAASFSSDDLMRMLHVASEAQVKVREAHQPRIFFELSILKLIHMERTEGLKQIIALLNSLPDGLPNDLSNNLSNNLSNDLSNETAKITSGTVKTTVKKTPVPATNLSSRKSRAEADQDSGAAEDNDLAYASQKDETLTPTDSGQNVEAESESESKFESGATSPAPKAPSTAPTPSKVDAASSNPAASNRPVNAPLDADSASSSAPTSVDDDLFGGSALRPKNSLSAEVESLPLTVNATLVAELVDENDDAQQAWTLAQYIDKWPKLVELMTETFGKSVGTVFERGEPLSLERGRLRVGCDSSFNHQILEEIRPSMQDLILSACGQRVRLDFELLEKDEAAFEDEFTRLKKWQESDPKLRLFIDLLGAEPEF